ncbi:MAG: hypothetical protein AAF634_00060 [Bacteroidota bacterium]
MDYFFGQVTEVIEVAAEGFEVLEATLGKGYFDYVRSLGISFLYAGEYAVF